MKMTLKNKKGFTLIELMIVIAIIGILAAIAIPNFISYRNKTYCKGAESDANMIAGRIADYFTVPSRLALPTFAQLGDTAIMSNHNTASVTSVSGPNSTIIIVVTDVSARCPQDYRDPMTSVASPQGFWTSGATAPFTFTKQLRR